MPKSIKLMVKMVTFVKNSTSLYSTRISDDKGFGRRSRLADVLDDCKPTRMPVQAVERGIRSTGADTSGKVLPLPGVYNLFIKFLGPEPPCTRLITRVLVWRKSVK